MCDFIRKKNNMNKFCKHKPHMHKEYNMCDFIRNLNKLGLQLGQAQHKLEMDCA